MSRGRERRAAQASEVHLHIGRLVIDARVAHETGVDAHALQAALHGALAERFADAAPAAPDRRRFSVGDAVADAVAARVRSAVDGAQRS